MVTNVSVDACFTPSEGVLGTLAFLWYGLTARSGNSFLVCMGKMCIAVFLK